MKLHFSDVRRYFRIKYILLLVLAILLAGFVWTMLSIALYPALLDQKNPRPEKIRADAAIVLGASVWKDKPSPVFAERIKHGIRLYKNGQVDYLIFTGGLSEGDILSESAAARQYALGQGIPAEKILIEEVSTNTYQNLVQACKLMQAHQLHKVMIVSDPLHMKRAMTMADELHINAISAATPTSRYISWRAKGQSLLYESFFYVKHELAGEANIPCRSDKS
ncbi:YdcF family protein [Undibacterium sp. Ji83W]|uniref:YdcF family protein n=1 Tax=Undibacterium sp. Ji83W TaxID=3413043 RepID=UPI003BF1857C